MGEVYRAHDSRLDRDIAIKVLPDYVTSDPDRLHRFEQEARATAALNHPNILAVHQMATNNGISYLVEELLEGETLRERLRRGPIPLRKAIDYAVQIAHGLAAAHDRGIVHRDLKPENLFITKDGRVKILDFGLARLVTPPNASGEEATVTQKTDPGVVLGTAGYMSPEQVRGKLVDHRTDIFAFGTILYEMVTGKQPFRKSTSADTMAAILNEEPSSVSQVTPATPPGMQRVVHRCLEKDPEQRFHSAHDLAFALEALSETGSSGVPAIKQSGLTGRWTWIAATLSAVAIAAGLLAWWRVQSAIPVVESVAQLTDDGQPKGVGSLVTDGSRIYFNEGASGGKRIMQVSTAGGETSAIPTRLTDPQTGTITPDGSSLMVFDGEGTVNPVWLVPLPTGEPRRLGTIEGQDGGFFPDGRVVISQGRDLYVTEKDGSNIRKLLSTADSLNCPSVSPDGSRIAVQAHVAKDQSFYLAEVSADGSGFHEIMRGTSANPVRCAYWTPDGNYLVSRLGGDLWLLPMETGILGKHKKAIQLTNGPLFYSSPCPSRDGKHIFAIGSKKRAELVRYDMKSKQFVSLLPGVSPINPSFSQDGQWVVYTTFPDFALWRSRTDGTDRVQLTYPPTQVLYPYLSPDGKKIVFRNREGTVVVMNADRTSQRELPIRNAFTPTWSPDGDSLVYSVQNSSHLETFDLRTGKSSVIPSSEGFYAALWIASDAFVAVTDDSTKMVLLGVNSGKTTELVSGMIIDWEASLDKRYIYYTTGGVEPKAMRIRLSDRKIEEVTSLKDLRRVPFTMMAVTPDGSPVFSRDIGSQEIYALTIKWP
jgi:Tol biopolymer transport system component